MKITSATFSPFRNGKQPKQISLHSQMTGIPADSKDVITRSSMMGFIGLGISLLMTLHPPYPTSQSLSTVSDPTDQNPKHDIFDYHCGFMNMALLLRNFMDAIKGGDGERIVRCIKMFVTF